MEGDPEISLDRLPIKRLEVIEENGAERYPSDVGYDEKRLSLIRRIDFAWAVDKDSNKKQKKSSTKESSVQPWPWKNMVENLQLAHQELSVIIDLINTVEANDAVTVAGMTRPKQLPNEHLGDLAVSAATKLQCFRNLSKYFKQSAKALEQQVARESRFYGALIRLQQNWKVKRQRSSASASSSEGFSFDLFDNSLIGSGAVFRASSISGLRVDRDTAGMLAISLPPNSCHSLHFGFSGAQSGHFVKGSNKFKSSPSNKHPCSETTEESLTDDEYVKQTHSVLREVHRTIFNEQVFDLVNREAFNPSLEVNVTGIRENHLELTLGQGASMFISLAPSAQDDNASDSASTHNSELPDSPMDTNDREKPTEGSSCFPNHMSYQIYLQQIFHEYLYDKAKDNSLSGDKKELPSQPTKDKMSLLGHFSLSLTHRIFSRKVLKELETLVSGVPYLQLISHPTWHSRTSSWTLCMNMPQSFHHGKCDPKQRYHAHMGKSVSQFRTKVVVTDDCIKVEGEGAPNIIGLFRGNTDDTCYMNSYGCDLNDLSVILLQQFACQVIRWLHVEALSVGIKASRNFLSLYLEGDHGETLSLVAHVDPEDSEGCISWWLVKDDGVSEDQKPYEDIFSGKSSYRVFLGYLSLDVLYSTIMDLVNLCDRGLD